MPDPIFNVLFQCTGNTARSILAEGILRKVGAGKFFSFSAGSQPKGTVNPFALKVLAAHGYPFDGLRSKTWSEFSAPGAPTMDFIFTVCDSEVWGDLPAMAGPAHHCAFGHRGSRCGRRDGHGKRSAPSKWPSVVSRGASRRSQSQVSTS